MFRFKHIVLLIVAFLVMLACNDIDNFSSDTSIKDFSVETILTPDVQLSAYSVSSEDKEITLLLSYGVHSFPIQFIPSINVNDPLARVVDLPDTVTLLSPSLQDAPKFHIMAQNGKTTQWTIRLNVVDRLSDADLKAVRVISDNKYIAHNAIVNAVDTTVYILAPQAEFPVRLSIDCELSDSATIISHEAGQEFEFLSYTSEQYITVKAADGFKKTWRMQLYSPTLIEDNEQVSASQWRTVSFMPSSTTITSSHVLDKIVVDYNRNILLAILQSSSFPTDLSMSVNAQLGNNVDVLAYSLGDTLTVGNINESKVIYLVDRTVADPSHFQLFAKRWTLRATPHLSASTNIKDFIPISSSPSSVVIDFDSILIDNTNASILVPVESGAENFPFRLKYMLLTEDNASIEGKNEYVVDHTFSTTDALCSFTVQAENIYTTRKWSIMCEPSSSYASKADVLAANILNYASPGDILELSSQVEVDSDNHNVYLSVVDGKDHFPLSVDINLSLSYGATITGELLEETLVFNTLYDNHQFTVVSADGSTSNTYTISLLDDDIENAEAELITFNISSLADSYILNRVEITDANNLVSIILDERGQGSFSFVPSIQVSEGAELTGIENNEVYDFGNINTLHNFTITSEDGLTSEVWDISVRYEPQITNSSFDNWTSQYSPQFWTTANNSFGKNTERIVNGDGYAAMMTTREIAGQTGAGSLFLGTFTMDLNHISNPRMMTYFGVPFTAEPTSLTFSYTYHSPGADKGSVVIELLNFSRDDVEYHGIGNEDGATLIHRGFLYLDDQADWSKVTVPLRRINSSLPVTHIHIVFSSSYKGEELQGDIGAVLKIDNIKLNY